MLFYLFEKVDYMKFLLAIVSYDIYVGIYAQPNLHPPIPPYLSSTTPSGFLIPI